VARAKILTLADRTVRFAVRGDQIIETRTAVLTGSTPWRTALAQVGGIVVLALGSACASPPDPGPQPDGPYVAASPEAFEGEVIGQGYCVDFVKAAAGLPRTAAWQAGAAVRGNPHLAPGTAIATFEADGSYTSQSGNHAAIYLSQDERGIWVYDQWRGQPVHKRLIRFAGGSGAKWGSKSNDGRRFAVIE
jgi:hypothetical protein